MAISEKICFSIPGFLTHGRLGKIFCDMYLTDKEFFYDDVCIGSVYGSPACNWNGGRSVEGSGTFQKIVDEIGFWNSRDIPIRYTFTNQFIDEYELYKDPICNKLLEITLKNQTIKNDIIIYSPKLKEYIEKTYGKDSFNFIYSTTLGLETKEEIDKYSKDNIVIPKYSLNNNFEEIEKLDNRRNLEFLADETCSEECELRKSHYNYISKQQLRLVDEDFKCPLYEKEGPVTFSFQSARRKHFISIDSMRNDYLPLGINKFKLEGRGLSNAYVVESYVYYLIKPEYRDYIRELLNSSI